MDTERAAQLDQPPDVRSFNAGVDMAADTLLAVIGPDGMVNRLDIENARSHAKRVGPVELEPSEAECIVWAMRNNLFFYNFYGELRYIHPKGSVDAKGTIKTGPYPDSYILADIRRRMKEQANG